MTVNSTAAASGPFIGTGVAQTLPFTFHAASVDEVSVEVDGTPVAGFSVTLESDGTGSVTGTFASGATIYIESAPSFQQDAEFNRFAPVFPDAFNPPLDRAAIRDIALKGMIDRAPIAPRDAAGVAGKFPLIGSDGSWRYVDGVPGATGTSDNTYTLDNGGLLAFKASDITRATASLVGIPGIADGRFNWTSGNFTGRADDVNIIKADDVLLTMGAWVRQQADGVAYQVDTGVSVSQAAFNDDYAAVHLFRFASETDDLAAWNRARAKSKRVRFVAGKGAGPGGVYLLNFAPLTSDMEIFGDGASTVIRPTILVNGNCFLGNSGSGTDYIDNVTFRDMTLYGRVEEGGFSEPEHLIRASGFRNLKLLNLRVLGFRGDGVYIGSGEVAGDQRFNLGVTIQNCYFDGINNDNRNAISVIDGRRVLIDNCEFRRCTRSNMPGPIDFEPDGSPHHLQSDITVQNCKFDACGGNLGQIGMLFPATVQLPSRISFTGNKFSNYIGTGADIALDMRRAVTSANYSMAVVIDNNQGVNGNRPIDIISAIGVVVTPSNQFQDYKGPSLIAFTGTTDKARDITFDGRYTRVGSTSSAGLLITAAANLTASGIYDTCGKAASDGYPVQFGATSSDTIALRNITIIPAAGQTIAVNSSGHTFTATTNRQANVATGGLTNQFVYRSEMRATLTYSNGWSDAGTTLVERNGEGRVSINLNLTGGTQTTGTLIAMLPIGYRPSAQVFGVFQSGTAFGSLRFDPDGSVFITPVNAPAASMKGFISFTVGQ